MPTYTTPEFFDVLIERCEAPLEILDQPYGTSSGSSKRQTTEGRSYHAQDFWLDLKLVFPTPSDNVLLHINITRMDLRNAYKIELPEHLDVLPQAFEQCRPWLTEVVNMTWDDVHIEAFNNFGSNRGSLGTWKFKGFSRIYDEDPTQELADKLGGELIKQGLLSYTIKFDDFNLFFAGNAYPEVKLDKKPTTGVEYRAYLPLYRKITETLELYDRLCHSSG